jgi:hypothetical protein
MSSKVTLRRYDVDEKLFYDILNAVKSKVVIKTDIKPYWTGYPDKDTVIYDGVEYLIICEHIFALYADFSQEAWKDVESWRQVILRKSVIEKPYELTIDGARAYMIMSQKLEKYYEKSEIDSILLSYSREYDSKKAQLHYYYGSEGDQIVKHENAYIYDINGAHQSALIEMFPRAEKMIQTLYDERRIRPINKCYVNYYVGMLCRKGYRGAYNFIVQRTTDMLTRGIKSTGGELVYANTDGFIVKRVQHELKTSSMLGDFKQVYKGDVYTYQGANYWIYQAGDKIVGSMRTQFRQDVDLREGRVVSYKILRDRNIESYSAIETHQVPIYAY